MRRVVFSLLAVCCTLLPVACARQTGVAPPACCATIGYPRASVESVLGKPAPPQSSKWHPFPSPPPNAPIYTTEHGYLTVTYSGPAHLAARFSMDFYEGKAPADGYRIIGAYLPSDAIDTKSEVLGSKSAVRVFTSTRIARAFPGSRGYLYVECKGPQPALLCDTADIAIPNVH
jgi:hypothetical protein